jgi:hypothetical protein
MLPPQPVGHWRLTPYPEKYRSVLPPQPVGHCGLTPNPEKCRSVLISSTSWTLWAGTLSREVQKCATSSTFWTLWLTPYPEKYRSVLPPQLVGHSGWHLIQRSTEVCSSPQPVGHCGLTPNPEKYRSVLISSTGCTLWADTLSRGTSLRSPHPARGWRATTSLFSHRFSTVFKFYTSLIKYSYSFNKILQDDRKAQNSLILWEHSLWKNILKLSLYKCNYIPVFPGTSQGMINIVSTKRAIGFPVSRKRVRFCHQGLYSIMWPNSIKGYSSLVPSMWGVFSEQADKLQFYLVR